MSLNHVNVRTADLEKMRDFFVEVAELRDGFRPDFGFPGNWLYSGEDAVIHLIQYTPGEGDDAELGPGNIDHVAFDGFDLETKKASLSAAGYEYDLRGVPGTPVRQLFVHGPEGVCLELQCIVDD